MAKKNKKKVLSSKDVPAKAGSKKGKAASRAKLNLTPFEKLVLFLALVFVVASPLALLFNKDIMIYIAMLNYFILGLAVAFKPEMIVDIMRKNNKRFEELYSKKITVLVRSIRVLGIIFTVIGIYFTYPLLLQ